MTFTSSEQYIPGGKNLFKELQITQRNGNLNATDASLMKFE